MCYIGFTVTSSVCSRVENVARGRIMRQSACSKLRARRPSSFRLSQSADAIRVLLSVDCRDYYSVSSPLLLTVNKEALVLLSTESRERRQRRTCLETNRCVPCSSPTEKHSSSPFSTHVDAVARFRGCSSILLTKGRSRIFFQRWPTTC